MEKNKKAVSERFLWFAVFPLLAVVLIVLGILYYNYEVVRLQDEKYGEISGIAGLKFDSLLDWRKHRLADVRRASLGPLVRKEMINFLNAPDNNTSTYVLKLQLNINKKSNVYADAFFADRSGAVLLSLTPEPPPVDKTTRIAIETSLKERKEVMSDLFRSPEDQIYIDAVAPVYDFNNGIMAFMILRSNASDYLFPLLSKWPTSSKTAETLLVRRDGDFVLFLNELRHNQNTALTLKMPVATENLTAAMAIFGKYGRFHGKDYRGVDVLAMILPVPETGWFMVAKVDSDEILSEVKYRAWVITLFVFLMVLILGGSVNVFYRNRNASDRKKAEEELRESENRHRLLFQTSAEGILVADIESKRFIYANPAIRRILGYSDEEITSMRVTDIHPEGYLPHITSLFQALARGDISQAPDIPCLRKDGRIIYADIVGSTSWIDGRMCNIGFFTDITERRRFGKKLQEVHELSTEIMTAGSTMREALKLCMDAAMRLSELDCGGAYVIDRSTGGLELIISTGLSRDFLNEASRIPADSAGAHIVYGKFPVFADYKNLGIQMTPAREKEGLRAIAILPIVYNDNVIACINVASHTLDKISAENQIILEMINSGVGNAIGRIMTEAALRESEEKTRTILENVPDFILVHRNGIILYINSAASKSLGFKYEEVLNKPLYEFIDPAYREQIADAIRRRMRGEYIEPYEIEIFTKSGAKRTVIVTGNLINFDGYPASLNVLTDITERKHAEEALRESEERYRIAIESANDGVTIVQREVHVYVNGKFLDIFGYDSAEEVVGKPRNIIVHPDCRERVEGYAMAREKGENAPQRYEFRGTRKDGRIVEIEVSVTTIAYKGEKAILAYMRDITERKQAEEALLESRKLLDAAQRLAKVGGWEWDVEKQTMAWTDETYRIHGFEPGEIPAGSPEHINRSLECYDPDNRPVIEAAFRRCVEKGEPYDLELRITTVDGRRLWIQTEAHPIIKDGIVIKVAGNIMDITDRRQAEKTLIERDIRFKKLSSHVPGMIYQFMRKPDGTYCAPFSTEAIRDIFGCAPEDVREDFSPVAKVILPEDYDKLVASIEYSAEHLNVWQCEYRVQIPGQPVKWLFGHSTPEKLADGSVIWHGFNSDITEHRRAEEALRESRARLDAILRGSPIPQFVIDKNHRVIHWNDALEKYSGIKAGEIIGTSDHWKAFYRNKRPCMADLLVDGDMEKIQEWYKGKYSKSKLIEGGYEATDFFPIMGQSGSWLYFTAVQIRDKDGSVIGAIETLEDITERKQAEEALKESEERFRAFIDHSYDAVFIHDSEGRLIDVNKTMLKMYRVSYKEALTYSIADYSGPHRSMDEVYNRWKLVLAGEDQLFQWQARRPKDGSLFDVEVYLTRITIGGNDIILANIRDITEQKQTQDAIIKEKEKIYTYIDNAPFGMMLIKWDGTISYVNQKFRQMLGYNREDIPDGRTWFRKAYPDKEYRHEVISAWVSDQERRRIGEQIQRIYTAECKDGSRKAINFLTVILTSGEYLMACEDITMRLQAEEEKRKLEERLARAEKMEALGTLAGGVAHDLNNVLGILVGYAELLMDEKDEASKKEFLSNILEGGRKAAAMVEDMLTMTRRGVASRDILNLNRLIIEYERSPEMESLLAVNTTIEMKSDLDPDLLNISGSRVHLEKMLFNLILNAFEAMPKGGLLTIRTANNYLEKPISGYDEVRQGEYVMLSVLDTGIGIKSADLQRIFEPFYTKKKMGRSGTGLGLAVVWGTVKDHNGYINVQSEEGNGSVFTLYFPVSREEITTQRVEVSVEDYMGNGETILVVDDVKGQRDLASEMLRKLNYNVTSASSGEEAVEYLKDKEADLIILDMIMDPGMDGLDTYRKILEIRPGQKAVIVSGFSETDRVEEAKSLGAGAYVKKPYIIEKLGLAVKNELTRRY